MRAKTPVGLAFLALALTPVMAFAATTPIEEFFTRLEATGAAPEAVVRVSQGSAQLLAVCTANCADGSSVTISAASCSAVDAACPTQAGYVQDLATGAISHCPACPCFVTATCRKSSVSCGSLHGDCLYEPQCYVVCDGVETWCPAPYGRLCPAW